MSEPAWMVPTWWVLLVTLWTRLAASQLPEGGGAAPGYPNLPANEIVLVGAGDIAECDAQDDEATADLLDSIPGTVFTAGDNAYESGSPEEFASCYDPSWGRHKARTRPSPGNHDYRSKGAGYFAYFGPNAGPPGRGYYSYDLGDWHIISLNSNISMKRRSAQGRWLRADLAASTKRCTLAYWHHPLFSSGYHGNQKRVKPLWDALYEHGVDIVIGGHDHDYERFAPQTPDGQADSARGIREFVVGTGGANLRDFSVTVPNTKVRDRTTHGVLRLTLAADHYAWEFIPVRGERFHDSGTGTCH